MKIIIRTPNFIGDTIMMLSAFELLRMEYPDASFTIVTKAPCVDLFRGKGVEKIIVDDTKISKKGRIKRIFGLIGTIRQNRYDLGVIFHNTFLDALIFKLSHIDTIIGYEKEKQKIILDFWLRIDRNRHYINHYAYLVNAYLGDKYQKLPLPKLQIESVSTIPQTHKSVVGFVLGGSNKGSRRYPQDLALELFSLLKDEAMDIVLLGDANDAQSSAIYKQYLHEHGMVEVYDFCAKTTIAQLIDTVAALDLLVTIDTSTMHIAAATQTPFITLVGKGTSIFEVVKPKVDFGTYLQQDNLDIDDTRLIANIKPAIIKDTIARCLDAKSKTIQ
jgi:heptosyltransferase-2